MNLLALKVAQADGTLTFEYDFVEWRIGDDLNIGSTHSWAQVSSGGAPAFAVLLGDLVLKAAVLLFAIVVGVMGKTLFLSRANKGLVKRARAGQVGYI